MVQMWNNWGCCCQPCPCYPFDGDAKDAAGGNELTATNPDYAASVMGKGAQFKGASHYLQQHMDCFSPAASDDVWRMWFWIKSVSDPPGDATFGYQGLITKGNLNYVYGWPPSVSFDGEWGIFYRDGGASGPDLQFVYKSDLVSAGIFAGTGLLEGHQYFFHWQINNTTKAASVDGWNATTGLPLIMSSGFGGRAAPLTEITGTMSVDESHPLRIGKNEGTAGQILGNGGLILVDNVGFSDSEGTASSLYNSGNGKPCPSIG